MPPPQEDDQINGMLSKIDIMPLQVRIDATIAEVDLTGALQYGTQFYFKSGGINAVLSDRHKLRAGHEFSGLRALRPWQRCRTARHLRPAIRHQGAGALLAGADGAGWPGRQPAGG